MDKPSTRQHSVRTMDDASKRMARSNLAMQLQLLPHDVLCNRLSRLSIKQVVRLKVLSREWRLLGICHPDLVFTKDTFFRGNTTRDANPASIITEFITEVDSVLQPLWATSSTTTTVLNTFAVKFADLRRDHAYHIDRWVSFSAASGAKHIALDFMIDGTGFGDDKYVFPLCNFSGPNGSCVNSLDLGYVCLQLPPSFCGMTNLKKFTLHMVSISGGDLQCLLLACALLEILSIQRCSLSSIHQELRRLQCLRVYDSHLEKIELRAPNLTTFEFDNYVTQIVLSETLKLSEATFVSNMRLLQRDYDALDYIWTELPTPLPHVHKLFLHLDVAPKVRRFSKSQTTFINLRHLNLNLEFHGTQEYASWVVGLVNLLESAPLLEELELHVS